MKPNKPMGTYASINLDNIIHNYKEAKRLVGENVLVSCVVKADAYGHGEEQVTKVLVDSGLSVVCVYSIEEAIRLRRLFKNIDIIILGYTPGHMLTRIKRYNLIQSISTFDEAIALNSIGKTRVHIKINTGMNRLGFCSDGVDELVKISKMNNIDICGVFTHLHSSELPDKNLSLKQFEKFNELLKELDIRGINPGIRHVCNSGGIISFPQMYMDLVREGIMLYGMYPSSEMKSIVSLKECMELRSYISRIMNIKKGEGVSYQQTYIANQDMKIATVSIGYNDGVFRNLSNVGEVIINDERRPVIGNVCMNMLMVDITGMKKAQVEDEVTIFGRSKSQYISIDEVAKWAGTISYEIICRVGASVPRIYFKKNKIIRSDMNSFVNNNDI